MRGTSFGSGEYISGPNFGTNLGNTSAQSIAELVLSKNNVVYASGIGGDPLSGYDIKSQDCTAMLKLSLLAQSKGDKFVEVYCGPDGVVRPVIVGEGSASPSLGEHLHSTFIGESQNRIDHVIIKGRQPLPIRYQKGTVNVMGAGILGYFNYDCGFAYNTKNTALGMEAWAEFETSLQSRVIQDKIQTELVQRSKWEQLVGYKATFAGIPRYASMSTSQTTPRQASIPFGNQLDGAISLTVGDSSPDGGGLFDISNVNALGAAILSIETGDQIAKNFPEVVSLFSEYCFTEYDYFILLDHECGLLGLSRGQNWFVVPGSSDDTVKVVLKSSGASARAWDVYYGFVVEGEDGDSSHKVNRYFFRRRDKYIRSVSEGFKKQQLLEKEVSISNVMYSNPWRGVIITGMGNDTGVEVGNIFLSYSVTKPSIKITSPYGDAPAIAARVAAGGVYYSSIVVQEKPAPIGYNGNLVYPPAPPDEEGTAYDVDSEVDELEGTIVDINAPFLGEGGVASFSSNIFNLINQNYNYISSVYAGGGYNLLPGQQGPQGGIINTIEFTYSDQDSVTTNVTTGPLYQPIGSYSDSQYIKRTESISRLATVVAGSNKEGTFIVEVDGRGRYEAILGTIEPVYPGDKVEVRLLNVPVEEG